MFVLRLISWICLVSLFLVGVLTKQAGLYIIAAMFTFGAFMAVYEILNMIEKLGFKSYKRIAALFGAFLILFVFCEQNFRQNWELTFVPVGLAFVSGWLYLLFSKEKQDVLKKLVITFGGFFMAVLPLYFLARVYHTPESALDPMLGAKKLLFLVVVTKIGDTFAYITGMLSNKILKGNNHKIVPSISPKKSWEGTIGGMIFSIIASFVLYSLLFNGENLLIPLIAGIVLFWGGFSGDLTESALKRSCGVKDSGNILPGMGGVYDLLDSFIFNAPLFYIFIYLFL